MQHWELVIFFMVISFVYASVGFGGGSSYLAILALYVLPVAEIKMTALICNIIVVTGGTIIFFRNGHIVWRKILPLSLMSVPMAFIGARMKLSQDTFFIILGCSLLVAAALLWVTTKQAYERTPEQAKTNILRDVILGGAVGFLSGMVGIGGGIFLSPLLNLIGWDDPRKIAATASFFILVNSVSGIIGQLSRVPVSVNYTSILVLAIAVLIGGQAGSRLSSVRFRQPLIKRLTAVLVFFAGAEVLFKHLPWFR